MIRRGTGTRFSPAVWMLEELEEEWELKQQFSSDACFVAGGTLLQTQWEKGLDCPANLISLEKIKSLQGWGKNFYTFYGQ